jgi:hypothetical protein
MMRSTVPESTRVVSQRTLTSDRVAELDVMHTPTGAKERTLQPLVIGDMCGRVGLLVPWKQARERCPAALLVRTIAGDRKRNRHTRR